MVTETGSVSLGISVQPLAHRDDSSGADFGLDVKFIHEPLGARQPNPHASSCRIPVLHRPRDIRDAGPLVPGDHADALLGAVLDAPENDLAGSGILDDV